MCRELFQRGVIERLVAQQLIVDTELTELKTRDYPLVVKHRVLPFVSYPSEWCGAMLKDAALLVLDLAQELVRHNLYLSDAHPWNVLFDGVKPYQVDFGSILTGDARSFFHVSEFNRFFLHPLQLKAAGYNEVARWVLSDVDISFPEGERARLLSKLLEPRTTPARFLIQRSKGVASHFVPGSIRSALRRRLYPDGAKARVKQNDKAALQRYRTAIAAITLPRTETPWTHYHEGYPALRPSEEWDAKQRNVHTVLAEARPETVLDIGCNRGWYSQLAASMGSKVVACDTDEQCISRLYEDTKLSSHNIHPIVMDIRQPTPGYGVCNREMTPATSRLSCDMVLALAVVHHLVLKKHLTFDQVADALAEFSKRSLLVEFVPKDDEHVQTWCVNGSGSDWYRLDAFQASLSRHFRQQTVIPSFPHPRVLILGER